MGDLTKVVIAGGGFAGLYAAMSLDKALARRPEIEVVLISRENFILFTPMLHEVAAGDLYPGDIINPLRRILRHVKVVEAEVETIDLHARKVMCAAGIRGVRLEFGFDHLLLTLGSETNFFDMAGVRDWAATMKNLSDAALLRQGMVALLEQAALETDEFARRQLLTFVTAGGGFAGVETRALSMTSYGTLHGSTPPYLKKRFGSLLFIQKAMCFLNWARNWAASQNANSAIAKSRLSRVCVS